MINLKKLNDESINDFIKKHDKMKVFIENLDESNSRDQKEKVFNYCENLIDDIERIENRKKKEKEEMSKKVQELIDTYTTKYFSM